MATQIQPYEPSRETQMFDLQQRQAKMFSLSPLVPEHLRKCETQQAVANCYIAMKMAEIMGEAPLIVMQNIHVVNGRAGFDTKYMIARANRSGVFAENIDWDVDKSDKGNLSVTAFATNKSGRRVEYTCDMNMARAEGWTRNKKYETLGELMLRYRSAAFLIRLYAPEVMLGYLTTEEVVDMGHVEPEVMSAPKLTLAAMAESAEANPSIVDGEVILESRSDERHGDQFDGADQSSSDDTPAWREPLDAHIADIAATKTVIDLNSKINAFDGHYTMLPDNAQREAQAAYDGARAILTKKG